MLNARRPAAPLLLSLLVFAALLPTVHSDVSWYDSGELTTAAALLGVGHPTGFPVFTTLGHGLSLLPVGGVAFRVALGSALAIALATGLLLAMALRQGARPLPAAVGALFYPAVFVVWLHGGLVEVYALNGLALALLAWLLVRPQPEIPRAAFITGLALGTHASVVLAAALLWLWTIARTGSVRPVIRAVPIGLFGALVILYLPLASLRDPWLDWGDPETPARLLRHLTASGIRESFAGEMGAGGEAGLRSLFAWARLAAGPIPWLPLSIAGAAVALARPRGPAVAMALVVAGDALFSALLNPMGQADLQTGLPGALALAGLLALLAGSLPGPRPAHLAALTAVLLCVLSAASEHLGDRATDEWAGSFGRRALDEASPAALVLTATDHPSSLALYLQGVEGHRPDLTVLVKQHLPDTALVADRYARTDRAVPAAFASLPPSDQLDRALALVRAELPQRGVLWELGDSRFDPAVAAVLRPVGLLSRVATDATDAARPLGAPPDAVAKLLASRAATDPPHFRTRRVLSDSERLRGTWHLLRGELDRASPALAAATGLDPESARAWVALAALQKRSGQRAEAIITLERALSLDPAYEKARENLDAYRGQPQ